MRYTDDITQLARAAAMLVAAGPPPAGTLPGDEQQTAGMKMAVLSRPV